MNKTSIDKKAAKKYILDCKNEDKTDQEIYDELIKQYFDKKSIALLITGTPNQKDVEKYKSYNLLLIFILIISILLKIIEVVMTMYQYPPSYLLALIAPLVNIYFIYQIAKYNAEVYKICGIFAFYSFALSYRNSSNEIILVGDFIFFALIFGLSFYVVSKLFPKYKPSKLQKDHNGNYIL